MRTFLLGLLAVSAVRCLPSHAQPPPHDQPQPDSVEAFLRRQMQQRRIPGFQIAVIRHGTILLLGSYGWANLEHAVPVTNKTVFPLNSATKSFTGVAIMQLVEAGKVNLAAPVSQYLDDLPAAWRAVTIRQLLTHTSGIPNIVDRATGKLLVDGAAEAAWATVQALPLEFAPGERSSYNQTNYLLLGQVIDKRSGQPFTQFITERQFQAVGMPRTAESGFVDSRDVVPHSARTYTYFRQIGDQFVRTSKLSTIFEEFPTFLRTGAGIMTTAEELARWIIALQQGQLLKDKASLTTLWAPVTHNNGTLGKMALGWPAINRPTHRAVGGIGGARAAFYVYPDDDLAIVILTNLQGASPEAFIDDVAGYYIPTMHASTGFGLPDAIKVLRAELIKRGFAHASDVVNEMKQRDATLQLSEDDLNSWGYRLMEQGQTQAAIEILKLTVRLYAESANTYDSLAEAYAATGDTAHAIKNYKRSLELNPQNINAVEHLKELEQRG